jgi:hypothetical protein
MSVLSPLRRYLQRLTPYAALFVLVLPLLVIEPLKVVAAVIFGSGRWKTGILVMLVAYVLSIFVVERIFHVVKPKLIRLPRFVVLWKKVVALREKTKNRLRWQAKRLGTP